MKIGLDLDGILVDQLTAILPKLQKMGISVAKADWTEWNYNLKIGISDDKRSALIADAWKELRDKMPKEEEDVDKRIALLRQKGHRISIITRRTTDSIQYVVEWLDSNNIDYDDLIIIRRKRSKFGYGIDVLIDDNPKTITELSRHTNKILYLREQPWNRNCSTVDRVIRVNSLAEAVSRILGN